MKNIEINFIKNIIAASTPRFKIFKSFGASQITTIVLSIFSTNTLLESKDGLALFVNILLTD